MCVSPCVTCACVCMYMCVVCVCVCMHVHVCMCVCMYIYVHYIVCESLRGRACMVYNYIAVLLKVLLFAGTNSSEYY